jgi:NADH-quinone oxidoreductase subunit G
VTDQAIAPNPDLVTVTIDGIDVAVPKGTLVIRAAEEAGIAIPRFCDHPLLDPAGACRQCVVEIPDAGNGRGFPMPQASCTTVAAQGMQVKTAATSEKARAAQEGILELLLINHPLDCPICDKGGECPLQNQAVANGRLQGRYEGVKRKFPTPLRLSPQLLLDRERCVFCQRCTRFAEQIAGDDLISLTERGAKSQVGFYGNAPFTSYFAGNVVQICPVGALTSEAYRFSARPFDLVSTVTTCDGCAAGCQLRADHRHGQVKRRQAGDLPAVNEEWSCDRGRFGFVSGRGDDRVTTPLVRKDGELVPASWPEALEAAAAGLAKAGSQTGVLTGGRLTREAAAAYAAFARQTLGTEDIDCRARALSAEETAVVPTAPAVLNASPVTYADLEQAKHVVLVGFEPEDEAPIVFLRLRKAVRKNKLQVTALAPYRSLGSKKLSATVVPTAPGQEAAALAGLDLDADTIVLGGERLAASPGALAALAGVAAKGARWAWLPRRPGEIGAIQAGAFPVAGRDTLAQLAALQSGELQALVIAGVELADLPDPAAAAAALDQALFVVSLETRLSDAAHRADVVFPVALLEETAGTFVNWEGRALPVAQVLSRTRSPMTDIRVLQALAEALGRPGTVPTDSPTRAAAPRTVSVETAPTPAPTPQGALVLATHRELLDDSRLLDGEPALIASARPIVARLNPATAKAAGIEPGDRVTLSTEAGVPGVTFDALIDPTVADGVVWAPARARGFNLAAAGLAAGRPVAIAKEVAA